MTETKTTRGQIVPAAGDIYCHFKDYDNRYEVIGVGLHSETMEPMVAYRALYETTNYPVGQIWTRPLAKWNEPAVVNGVSVQRFIFVRSKQQ